MRKLPLISLTGLLIMVACNNARKPSTANFKTTISQYLAKHGQICTSIGRQFPIDIPASAQQEQYGLGPQLTALQQTGLVSETDTTVVIHGMLDALRGSGLPQPVRRYQLTPQGQKYFQQVPGTFGPTGGFCYGQRIVDSVVKWTDPVSFDGHAQSEVTYTYKIANLAPWSERSEIQKAFPDIAAKVGGVSKTGQTIGLRLGSNEWEVVDQ